MRELLKGMFSKDTIFGKKNGLPPFLYKRYHKLLLFTAISFILGTACCIMAAIPLLVAPFALLTISLLLISLHFKYSIESRGFTVIRGKVVFTKEMLSTDITAIRNRSLRRPSYYHIQTDTGEIFRIAANKVSEEIPEGLWLNIYASLNVFTYERNGVQYLSTMWGYELDHTAKEA